MKITVAAFTGILLLIFSFIFLGRRLNLYEQEMESAFDKESHLMIWELQDIESGADQILNTSHSLISRHQYYETDRQIDYASEIFVHFIEGYNLVTGFKGLMKDSILLKVIKLEGGHFLRKVAYLKEKNAFFSERFMINDKGELIVLERWNSEAADMSDTTWLSDEKYHLNEIVFSDFFRSNLLKKEIFCASKKSTVGTNELLSIDISLNYLSDKFKRLKQKGSYYILCDREDNIRLIATGYKENFEVSPKKNLSIDKVEVTSFLDLTHNKNYFPDEYISFKEKNTSYLGKWISFNLGNKEYKMGYLVSHDVTLHKLWLMIIAIAVLSPVGLLFMLSKYRLITLRTTDEIKPTTHAELAEPDANQLAVIRREVDKLFNKEKVYLDPNCSVGALSDSLSVNRELISKSILLHENKTVKEYINDFRINEAIVFIQSNKNAANYSIEYISEKYGFRSRVSFHREFKKRTNYSPAEYIALHKP